MKLVSRLMVLTVGVVLVVSVVPGGAAEQPCALLTLQDVTRVVGRGYTLAGDGIPTLCMYTKGGIDPRGPANKVTLTLQELRIDVAQRLPQLADDWRARGAPVKPASGLGPGAYYIDADIGNFLVFGKGKLLIGLGVYTDRKRDVKAALALAKIVYARL